MKVETNFTRRHGILFGCYNPRKVRSQQIVKYRSEVDLDLISFHVFLCTGTESGLYCFHHRILWCIFKTAIISRRDNYGHCWSLITWSHSCLDSSVEIKFSLDICITASQEALGHPKLWSARSYI